MTALSTGMLLVANPELPDANFDRTVVLILAHGDDGTVGVILNRPGEISVAERFPRWDDLLANHEVIFEGGPVNGNAVIGLAKHDPGIAGTLPDGIISEIFPDVGIVDLDRPDERTGGALCALRVFAGYAGWSPGQLAGEVEAGGWWVVRAQPQDVWTARPEMLWRDVLRRQRGPLALVSSFPRAPELN